MSDPLLHAAHQLMARDRAITDAIEDCTHNPVDYPDTDDIWSGKATFPRRRNIPASVGVGSAAAVAANPPAQTPLTNFGTKRKAGPSLDPSQIKMPVGTPVDASGNVIRGKINRFLESGEMKAGDFCDAIGVSGNGYRRFMAMNGKNQGAGSDTYVAAWEFFKKRDMAGVKTPKKQKTATPRASNSTDSGTDISDVHLEGEDTDEVEVYDTCDEIRKKIAAHLRKPGITQAQFCRDLLAQYHTSAKRPSQVQSAQLTRFRGYKGADTGNTSCVFYAAYVFFEKLRVKEGKPKSKHREEMESIWGSKGGFNVSRGHHRGYYCMGDQRPYQDQYGRVSFH